MSFLQPGQDSEQVISKGVNIREDTNEADPKIRYPIPNERELMRKKATRTVTATRKISRNDGSEVSYTTDLLFQPPGLSWRGDPAITGRQLQTEVEAHRQMQRKKAKYVNTEFGSQ